MRLVKLALGICSIVPVLLLSAAPPPAGAEQPMRAAPMVAGPVIAVSGIPPIEPKVTVEPATNLLPDQYVEITAQGLPSSIPVKVVLCYGAPHEELECLTKLASDARTDSQGRLSLGANLPAVAYYYTYGVQPTYCRDDVCEVVVYWTDEGGNLVGSVESPALVFQGSAATIAANPTSGLNGGKLVRVTGTAKGSAARYVTIVQVSCWDHLGESGCQYDVPLASVPLRSDDTFAASVRVLRVMPDGSDCQSDAECYLTARFPKTDSGYESLDDTFGVPAYGHPGVGIHFGQSAGG